MNALLADLDGWKIAAVLLKALTYAASLSAAGGLIFRLIFDRSLAQAELTRLVRLTVWLAGIGAAATILHVSLTAGMLAEDISGMWEWGLLKIILGTPEGLGTEVRLAGLGLIALIGLRRNWSDGLAATGIMVTVLSYALVGHTAAADAGTLLQMLVSLHLMAVAYWIGALWPLRQLTYAPDLPRTATIMARFGNVAAYAVGALVVAGLALTWALLRQPVALLDSDYGRLLLVKLALVAVLLALAAGNKLRLVPRLASGDASAVASLRKSITAEIVAVLLILLVTASFTTLTGPPGE